MTVTSKQQHLPSEEDPEKQNLLEMKWGPEKQIEFERLPNEELGMTVVHGRMYTNNNALGSISGLFIKSIAPNSAAGRTGQFQTGDKILEVCGTYVDELSREDAIAFIRTVENPISFVVQSMTPVRKPYFSVNERQESEPKEENEIELQQIEEVPYKDGDVAAETEKGIEADDEQKKNQAPSEIESEVSEDEDDDDGLESHDSETVKKRFEKIENKIEIEIERGPHGLGLSIAGHRDRNKMAVYICGINPNSSVYKTGSIQVGDEILKVNDSVLHGHSHLNASSIIKRMAGPTYKFLLSRRKIGIDELAVRPVTQFPVVLEEETSQQKYENYPNVRDIAVEKGTNTLGIMIIEGKHAELGQGIFVSDIQEDSAAEKAGLEIGEMILAVNKETLVGSSYDTATSLLKRVEGLVLMTVSAPTKKVTETASPSEVSAETTKLPSSSAPSQSTSRAATPVPVDPTTCSIVPGMKTTIDIAMENKALGLFFAYSKDPSNCKSIVVVDVYSGGCAEKDGRLQAGDEILEVAETVFKDVGSDTALRVLHQILPKMRLIVYRPPTIKYETVEVELIKVPGKGIGLSMLGRRDDKGTFVFEMLEGGNAESDGRISRGDILVSVNDINVENSSSDEVGAVLKIATGKTALKFNRYTSTVR